MIHWLHPKCEWLRGREGDVFSQFGEDGLVDAIFDRIGTTNKVAFECGCSDGVTFSNTKRLDARGWGSLLVDSNARLASMCFDNRPGQAVVFADVTKPDDYPAVAYWLSGQCDLDLCVIDIDGQDYWVVHDMEATPRVLMVEYECPDKDSPPPERGGSGQAGSSAIHALLSEKWYEVVVRTDCNAIAVRRELFPILADA